MPFENSTNGSVVSTLDLFADRQSQYPDIYVHGEAYLDVHHYLLGYDSIKPSRSQRHPDKPADASIPIPMSESESRSTTPTPSTPHPSGPRTEPLTDLSHVQRIYSHPQAFGQCEAFLSTYLRGVDRQEVSSTSKAAQIVSEDRTRTSAAISSKVAAGVHGLDVLAKGIEDRDDNTTRFFFLRRGPRGPDARNLTGNDVGVLAGQKFKTLLVFTVNHLSAGALADALTVFKRCDLNLTSIYSRPSRVRPWHYIFFVEFERGESDGGRLNEAMRMLQGVTEGCRWYGSWRDRGVRSDGVQ